MNDVRIELEKAVLDGDRYTAYQLAKNYVKSYPSDSVGLWYLAYATDDLTEYRSALIKLAQLKDPDLSPLAENIIKKQSELVLSETRLEKLWKWITGHVWFVIGALVVFIGASIILFLVINNANVPVASLDSPTTEQTSATFAPTVTASPFLVNAQYSMMYNEGQIQLLHLEFPTQRIVLSDTYSNERATPVNGAQFAALHIRFTCSINQAICESPPQADIVLVLNSGNEVFTQEQSFSVEGEAALGASGVAQGRSIDGWLVYQVPISATIVGLHVYSDSASVDAPPVEMSLE